MESKEILSWNKGYRNIKVNKNQLSEYIRDLEITLNVLLDPVQGNAFRKYKAHPRNPDLVNIY